MGPSISISKASSEQSANVSLTQQFAGTCDVTCQNIMSGVVISIIDSNVGGNITISQTCATNATCMINSMMDGSIDVQFTAANTSSANAASSLYPSIFSWNQSESSSRQDIKENITQSTNETCNISSINQMNNISIFASGSNIGGSIAVEQNASTQGQCQLTNAMTASAYASGMATNQAKSGKDKKGDKGGTVLYYVIGAVVFVALVFIIGKIISSYSANNEETSKVNDAILARASLGCPGGAKPYLDKFGKVMIDPRTKLPICPPPSNSTRNNATTIQLVEPISNPTVDKILSANTPSKINNTESFAVSPIPSSNFTHKWSNPVSSTGKRPRMATPVKK